MYDPEITGPIRIETAEFTVTVNEKQLPLVRRLAKRFHAKVNWDRYDWRELCDTGWVPKSPREFAFGVWVNERHDWRGFKRACTKAGIHIEFTGPPVGSYIGQGSSPRDLTRKSVEKSPPKRERRSSILTEEETAEEDRKLFAATIQKLKDDLAARGLEIRLVPIGKKDPIDLTPSEN